jgi:hypothetical protein
VVAEHFLVPPGEASVRDEHYGGPRPDTPARAVRPRTAAEREFCALGPVAEAFITGAAAAGSQPLFRLISAAYERRSPGIASHWPFESWGRFLPEHTTAVSLLDRLLHHASVVITSGDSYRMKQARAKGGPTLNKQLTHEGWGLLTGHQR